MAKEKFDRSKPHVNVGTRCSRARSRGVRWLPILRSLNRRSKPFFIEHVGHPARATTSVAGGGARHGLRIGTRQGPRRGRRLMADRDPLLPNAGDRGAARIPRPGRSPLFLALDGHPDVPGPRRGPGADRDPLLDQRGSPHRARGRRRPAGRRGHRDRRRVLNIAARRRGPRNLASALRVRARADPRPPKPTLPAASRRDPAVTRGSDGALDVTYRTDGPRRRAQPAGRVRRRCPSASSTGRRRCPGIASSARSRPRRSGWSRSTRRSRAAAGRRREAREPVLPRHRVRRPAVHDDPSTGCGSRPAWRPRRAAGSWS